MKLFISCGNLQPGGAERVISLLSTPFASHFNEVSLLMWVSAPVFYPIDERVSLVDIEKEAGSKSLIKKMRWFRSYVKSERPDIVLSFLYPWSLKVLVSMLFDNTRIIVAERQDPRMVRGGWIIKQIRNALYKKACGILVQTYKNKNYYPNSLKNKIEVIYNPIMMEKSFVGKAVETKKEKIIVSVGRLSSEKNHILLINSFCDFYKTHTDYRLVLYGDGVLREDLENIVKKCNMTDSILFMGNTKDVFNCIKNASVFVLPSKYEGMPNALLEAMCLGLCCISTKVSGAIELIKDGVNGRLVDVDDVQQMSNAISELVDNEDEKKRIAKKATELYDLVKADVVFKKWINYLDSKITRQ